MRGTFGLAKTEHGLYHRGSADKVPALGKDTVRGALHGDKEPIIPKDIHKQFIEGERAEWRQFKELLRSLRKK